MVVGDKYYQYRSNIMFKSFVPIAILQVIGIVAIIAGLVTLATSPGLLSWVLIVGGVGALVVAIYLFYKRFWSKSGVKDQFDDLMGG